MTSPASENGAVREKRGPRRKRSRASLFSQGEPMVWLTGGGLVISLLMIVGLLLLVLYQGMGTFWPSDLPRFVTVDGQVVMGEVTRTERYGDEDESERLLLRTGNFDLSGEHFRWVEDGSVAERTLPPWALVVERTEWGIFYGFPKAFVFDGEVVADDPAGIFEKYDEYHDEVTDRRERRRKLETGDVGKVNHTLEKARLAIRSAELESGKGSPAWERAIKAYEAAESRAAEEFKAIRQQIDALNRSNERYVMVMETAQGREKEIPLDQIVRAFPANRLDHTDRAMIYVSRWIEFLADEPREANSEGGVYPAIFGTVVMTLIMSLAVMPFGIMAALYLREYAKAGTMISIVRISINNLAGVPSIVFGVFGLGFFCYIIGASIDQLLFAQHLPNPTYGKGGVLWAALTLALLTLPVVIVATEEGLAAVPRVVREGSLALGATKFETIWRVVIPAARSGIVIAVMLGLGRAFGETMLVLLVTGNAANIPELGTDIFFQPVRTMTATIASEMGEVAQGSLHYSVLFAIGIILFLFTAAINSLATRLVGGGKRRRGSQI